MSIMQKLPNDKVEKLGADVLNNFVNLETSEMRIALCTMCKDFGGEFTFAKKQNYRCWHDASDHPAAFSGRPNVCREWNIEK
jgi:hypothetical protein